MKNSTKIWLIIAVILLLIGSVIFTGVLTTVNFDFSNLSSVEFDTKTYRFSQDFNIISIDATTADIEFVLTDDEKTKVTCYEQTNIKHEVTVKDGMLSIAEKDDREWFDRISFFVFESSKITIYLPESEYGVLTINSSTGDIVIPEKISFTDIDISASTADVQCDSSVSGLLRIVLSTGDIDIENISAGKMELSVTTGDINIKNATCDADVEAMVTTGKAVLTDVYCKNFISSGNTGDLILKYVAAEKEFSIKRSTGGVKLDSCDAKDIYIKTDTGDVTGNILSEKVFITETDTGTVKVPKTTKGGKCEITTDTGDIKISIK